MSKKTIPPPDERCYGLLMTSGPFMWRCANRGRYRFEGDLYCQIHHPPSVKLKQAERRKNRDKIQSEKEARWEIQYRKKVLQEKLSLLSLGLSPCGDGGEWCLHFKFETPAEQSEFIKTVSEFRELLQRSQ